jgi:hypothetical protein
MRDRRGIILADNADTYVPSTFDIVVHRILPAVPMTVATTDAVRFVLALGADVRLFSVCDGSSLRHKWRTFGRNR